MLAQKYRFHGYGALKYVYRNGQSVRQQYFTLKYIANKRRKNSRFAVVVSKKVHKGAVGRNRIRRRMYEILRQESSKLDASYDIACIVFSSEVREAPYETLTQSIRDAFTSAGLYSIDEK